jgi:hypothetical protein
MARKNPAAVERERLAASIKKDLPSDGGSYTVSSATAIPLRKALRGTWIVVAHTVAGESFIERFAARSLRGAELADAQYHAEYEFKDAICIKRIDVTGVAALPDGAVPYHFCQRVALSWDLEGSTSLRVRPELGYQTTVLDDNPAVVKELDGAAVDLFILFSIDGDELILEEGDDTKRLRRLA